MVSAGSKSAALNPKITEEEADVGIWYDAIHWQDEEETVSGNSLLLYCLVSTDSGVYELRKRASSVSQSKALESTKILSVRKWDPLWALNKKNGRISVDNGYSKYTYDFKGKNLCRLTKNKTRDDNEEYTVSWRSRFYNVLCKNVIGSEDTYVHVSPADINLTGKSSSLKLTDTKVLQIVPASQNRFVLFGTKVLVIQVIPALDFKINILESSIAPHLPLSVGGYLECNHLVIQCPYASKSRDTTVRIPLPSCLTENVLSCT